MRRRLADDGGAMNYLRKLVEKLIRAARSWRVAHALVEVLADSSRRWWANWRWVGGQWWRRSSGRWRQRLGLRHRRWQRTGWYLPLRRFNTLSLLIKRWRQCRWRRWGLMDTIAACGRLRVIPGGLTGRSVPPIVVSWRGRVLHSLPRTAGHGLEEKERGRSGPPSFTCAQAAAPIPP